MRFYIDRGAGCEGRGAIDIPEIQRVLKIRGAKNIHTARKYGWSNMPSVVTFDFPAAPGYGIYSGMYSPDDAELHEWLWDAGLFIGHHWNVR